MTEKANTLSNSRSIEAPDGGGRIAEDEFLNLDALISFKQEAAQKRLRHALSELNELIREKKWEDAAALFHPVEEKLPELVERNMDVPVIEKNGFILSQLKRFDEAIKVLMNGIGKDPENFLLHNSLAYTAYNSLYAAKNREILISGKNREDRIRLAHEHFQKACQLKPDGVTNFYREGMLYKQIEAKEAQAFPCFRKAIGNWDALEPKEQETRHQERKNFVKALFQLSSLLLGKGQLREALETIRRCLAEDEKSCHVSLLYKYFALGKVNFHMGRFADAKNALLFAIQCETGPPKDFVCELLARTYLALDNTGRAMEIIKKVPEKKRRPYYRWTEADVWCACGDLKKAKDVLKACQERDNRSKHKTLIRLAKIEYLRQNYALAFGHAESAGRFFTQKWGNIHAESLFWQAAAAYRLGQKEKALALALKLKETNPEFHKLRLLMEKLKANGKTHIEDTLK